MKTLLFAAVTAMSLLAVPAFANDKNDSKGGFDVGPLGQCFDARACGHRAGHHSFAFAPGCHMVRERMTTESGHVIFKKHKVCG